MKRQAWFAAAAQVVLLAGPLYGWHDAGHAILSRASLLALPEDMPAFFRSAGREIAHYVYEPDVSKDQRSAPYVRASERAEHYLDLEFLRGAALPKYRHECIALCCSLGVQPEAVGYLPYAVAEWSQRLAVAFSEHRAWPDNAMVRTKCLVYAGFLAHYAQDLCQPLHLTIHWDGRANPDGSSPRSGIHGQVDWLVEMLGPDPAGLARSVTVTAIEGDVMDAVLTAVRKGNQLVDATYALEPLLPEDETRPDSVDPRVVAFTRDRAEAAVAFTASLYEYAWALSAGMKTPYWADRSRTDAE